MKAKRMPVMPVALVLLVYGGCAHVPGEVRTAMEKQSAELKLIRQSHQDSVEVLFGQIRALQHFILDDLQRLYEEKYARGPKAVTLEDKSLAVIYTDDKGKGLPPSFNPDRDVIAISTNRIISDWFQKKREYSDQKLDAAKAEFLKLQGHIQIAQEINEAVTDYVDSLINLKNKQKELGQTLTKQVGRIPGLAGIQTTVLDLLKVDTKDLDAMLPKPAESKSDSAKSAK
jgi:hypothetical protein